MKHPSSYRQRLLDSLPRLARHLQAPPPAVVQAAVAANPWFTPYYINESLRALLPWLDPVAVATFLAGYPPAAALPQRVSIIAAGNLPLVGFHDVLMTLLAGHRAEIKYSHQDRVLMDWLRVTWQQEAPFITDFLHPVSNLNKPAYLVATGSNHTARYLRRLYQDTPALIRHNRYSVAVLHRDQAEADLIGLWRDVLMYNGLGCRNVSNLILLPGASLDRWLACRQSYPEDCLNPRYLERVLQQTARKRTLKESGKETPWLVLAPAKILEFASMGIIHYVEVPDETAAANLLMHHRAHLQCVVGRDTPFGQTQTPGLGDFADGVDTMAWLCKI